MDIILEGSDLSLSLDERIIFQGLNLRLLRGEIYGVVGASGSGKSVLLKLLNGLIFPQEGWVRVEGINLAEASKEELRVLRMKTAFVFQDAALISNMSILDNVALPLRYHTDLKEGEVQERIAEVMGLFEVDRHLDRSLPSQISLEMRKRIAFARALVLKPSLMFLDEPTAGLEAEADRLILKALTDYQEETRASLLIATHESSTAFAMADRIGLLGKRRIMTQGTPEEMRRELKRVKSSGFHLED
jgi:phospholipid/cholesterol/gamma-HCH transport system ATP-binding protein